MLIRNTVTISHQAACMKTTMKCQKFAGKTRFLVAILLVTLQLTAYAQYYPAPKPVDPDKEPGLLNHLKNIRSGKEKIQLLLDLSNLNFNKPLKKETDLDRAMNFAAEASKLSKKLHSQSGYNDAQFFIADIFTEKNDMESAENILKSVNDTTRINLLLDLSFKYWLRENEKKEEDWKNALILAQQAKDLCIKLHQPEKEILALKDIAVVHADQGNPSAERELLEVIKKYRSIGYLNLHYTYSQLAELNFMRGNPGKALYYSLETIKSMKMTGDSIAAGDFYNWHAAICYNNDEYQKSIDYATLAINSYKIHAGKYNLTKFSIFGIIPKALRRLKRYKDALSYTQNMAKKYPLKNDADKIDYASIIGNIYRDMKEYDKAEGYFARVLELSKKQGVASVVLYLNLGQFYVESGRYTKARPYLYKALDFPENERSSSSERHLQYMLFLADSATGHYLQAIKHLNKNHQLNEAGLREAKDKEVQKLSIQFETAKKESEIKIKDQRISLLKQNARLEEGKLHQANLAKNITIGATLLSVMIMGLLYKQYRNKQKNNLIITQKNEQLRRLLQEKEWLIKEVHHRVKNNLHTVISLLEVQAAYLEDDALKALENSRNRIYAMSLIHQKLYQSDDVKTIDMAIYIPEMVQYLSDSFDIAGQIHFRLKIDPLNLDVAYAIPLALIINEAVTNSIKYAFPGKSKGEISISLSDHEGQIKLELADNGIGMDSNIPNTEQDSLGLDLMKGLSKDINAEISFNTNYGTTIIVIFKQEELYYTDDFLIRQGTMEI
jgi:two-component sensor histidine kinase